MICKRPLILAPHPDDELLGCGGLLARAAAEGAETHVAIVTRGAPPDFDEELIRAGRAEMAEAHRRLGVARTHELDGFPAARLDETPHRELNAALGRLIAAVRPDALLVPFPGDLHRDHARVFESALVAARPGAAGSPARILAYETLSETNWNAPYLTPGFRPTVFVDIAEHLEAKLDALACYRSQMRAFPDERSREAVEALARLRGATVGVAAAEAFVLVREIAQ